jgi:hypothetical protein
MVMRFLISKTKSKIAVLEHGRNLIIELGNTGAG